MDAPPVAMVTTHDGSLVVLGHTSAPELILGTTTLSLESPSTLYVAGFSGAGAYQWHTAVGCPVDIYPRAIVRGGDDAIVFVGELFFFDSSECSVDMGEHELSLTTDPSSLLIASLTGDGSHRWSHGIEADDGVVMLSLAGTQAGGALVLITTGSETVSIDDTPYPIGAIEGGEASTRVILEFDGTGAFVASSPINPSRKGFGEFSLRSVLQGGYILATNADYAVASSIEVDYTNALGDVVWSWEPPLGTGVLLRAVEANDDGGCTFAATTKGIVDLEGLGTFGNDYSGEDVLVVRLDGQGAPIWARMLGGDDKETISDMTVMDDGSVAVFGSFASKSINIDGLTLINMSSQGSSGYGTDLYLVVFSPEGALRWATSYGAINSEYATAVASHGSGEWFLSGTFVGGAYEEHSIDFGDGPLETTEEPHGFILGISE